ncbi:MAG: CPXCG motif-containing cysteine-rich protein [Proteobacteria bacterium]|nr:CPXCG motif-containing cysteine-rich protein [Pseudomonadota bacterium]
MITQEIVETQCPYCGESIQLLIDCSIPQQDYFEDCQVCCQPIQVFASVDGEGIPAVTVNRDTD